MLAHAANLNRQGIIVWPPNKPGIEEYTRLLASRQGLGQAGKNWKYMNDKFSKYASYLSLGFEIAAGLSLPILAGYWVDSYFSTFPWFLLAGCLIGMINIFLTIFRLSKSLNDDGRNEA